MPRRPIGGEEVQLTSALDGVGGQRHAPAALPPGKTRYPLYQRLGGSQSRSGQLRKISPPLRFDPRTVQPVSSRYTDWAIPADRRRLYVNINVMYMKYNLPPTSLAGGQNSIQMNK